MFSYNEYKLKEYYNKLLKKFNHHKVFNLDNNYKNSYCDESKIKVILNLGKKAFNSIYDLLLLFDFLSGNKLLNDVFDIKNLDQNDCKNDCKNYHFIIGVKLFGHIHLHKCEYLTEKRTTMWDDDYDEETIYINNIFLKMYYEKEYLIDLFEQNKYSLFLHLEYWLPKNKNLLLIDQILNINKNQQQSDIKLFNNNLNKKFDDVRYESFKLYLEKISVSNKIIKIISDISKSYIKKIKSMNTILSDLLQTIIDESNNILKNKI